MKCLKCGHNNESDALYCNQCGSSIAQDHSGKIYCKKCGQHNSKTSRFCIECGEKLLLLASETISGTSKKQVARNRKKQKKEKVKRTPKPSSFTRKYGLFTVVLILLLAVISWMNQDNTRDKSKSLVNFIEDPVLAVQVLDIASKFRCACGTCGGTPLEKCSCEFAVAERQFIKEKIKAGLSTNQVIKAVKTNYGWLKAENEDQADKN
jgi:hypothetical protein